MRHGAQRLRVERLIGWQICNLDPQHVLKRASDVVTLGDFCRPLHRALKFRLSRFRVFGEADSNIDNKAAPGLDGIEPRAVAADDASPFQILNAAQAGRRRKAHLFGQRQIADPTVHPQFTQYCSANFIHTFHRLQGYVI